MPGVNSHEGEHVNSHGGTHEVPGKIVRIRTDFGGAVIAIASMQNQMVS